MIIRESFLVGGEFVQGDELRNGKIATEGMLEGAALDDMKSSLFEGNGLGIIHLIDFASANLGRVVAEFVGDLAGLVVTAELVQADSDAERLQEIFLDDAIGKFIEPGVNLVHLGRSELFEFRWETKFHRVRSF